MNPAAVATVLACGFLCGLAVWACAATRRRRAPQLARREAAVRSALYRTLDSPGEPSELLDDLDAAANKLLEAKARALLPALRGEDRETLARLLESRGATEAARRQCRSRRATARAAACALLGDVGSSFAVLDLVPLLDDPRPVVRTAAARALGRLGQPAGVIPLIGAAASKALPVDGAAEAIHQIGDWSVSLLHPCLADQCESTRALAVELLGQFHNLESVDAIVEILADDQSTAVRVRAARALGRIGSPRAIQPLIDCVASGPGAVKAEAIAALGKLAAVAAVPTLRVTLLGPSQHLSQAAAGALAAITPKGVEILQEIADDQLHPAASTARRELAAGRALAESGPSDPSLQPR